MLSVGLSGEILRCASSDDKWGFSKGAVFNFLSLLSAFYPLEWGRSTTLVSGPWSQPLWALRAERSVWGQAVIAAGDAVSWGAGADWTFLWQRGFTKQLTGQRYQGIVNGYDMICLASFLIKACWGNVSASTRRITGQSSVNGGHCLSPSFLQRSKFHCDYTKASGHWPGLLDMLWWGDIEAKQFSTNN